jgi:hypothetical protein
LQLDGVSVQNRSLLWDSSAARTSCVLPPELAAATLGKYLRAQVGIAYRVACHSGEIANAAADKDARC